MNHIERYSVWSIWRTTKASIIVEFALIAPVLIVLIVGVVEISWFIRAEMKLSYATWMLTNIISQQTSVTAGSDGSLGDLCNGAASTMVPFDTTPFGAGIALITNHTESGGDIAADWNNNGSCPGKANIVSPAAISVAATQLTVPGSSMVVVSASYKYQSFLSFFIRQPILLTQTVYARPRADQPILCPNC